MPRTVSLTRVPSRTLLAWMRENGVGERWQDIKAPPERNRDFDVVVGRSHGPMLRQPDREPPALPIAGTSFIDPPSKAALMAGK